MIEKTEFLPFHAINEFMRPDFRMSVIREVLTKLPNLSTIYINKINHLTNKYVKVPGFRHSDKAPILVKVLPMSKAFEKSPDLVAAILAAWAETHSELRIQVYDLLQTRNWIIYPNTEAPDLASLSSDTIKNWPIFPIHVDRTNLPGFFPHWPKGENFETLYRSYSERYPESDAGIDKVSLMTVWLTMRLPYQVDNGNDADNHDENTPID
jgi:hypothetical protein